MSVNPMKKINSNLFSPDIREFLSLLYKYNVEYLIIGGQAVIFYGHIRLTGDVDIFYNQDESNAKRLYKALNEFWDNNIPGIRNFNELMEDNLILYILRSRYFYGGWAIWSSAKSN